MDTKTIAVQEVTGTLAAILAQTSPAVDIGNGQEELLRKGILEGIQRRMRMKAGCRSFILSWQGDRSPRGAQVLGREIGWAQHGCARDVDGEIIGTYDWLSDERDDRRMLVFINPS